MRLQKTLIFQRRIVKNELFTSVFFPKKRPAENKKMLPVIPASITGNIVI